MYKFKASKYKNANPKVPKKEACVLGLCVGSPLSQGNHIKASAAYMVFNTDTRGGGSLGVLPLGVTGKQGRDHPMLHCHSDIVTDFDFSPFDDGLVATCSADCMVKLWSLPTHEDNLQDNINNPDHILPPFTRRVENVLFHPTADKAIAITHGSSLSVWDIDHTRVLWDYSEHDGQVLGTCWHHDGSLLATLAKDKMLRILDPRTNTAAGEVPGLQNAKDGRVVWLGDCDKVLTSGFTNGLQRLITLRDIRNLEQPLKTVLQDTSPGVIVPLYDADTNMIFFVGMADSSVIFNELTDAEPYIAEASRHICEQPTKGVCLVPKRALNVMQGEVNRLLMLTPTSIVPITYQVPRKSYREFHADLFPNTRGAKPSMTAQQWYEGANEAVAKISLDPSQRNSSVLRYYGDRSERNTETSQDVAVVSRNEKNGNGSEEYSVSQNGEVCEKQKNDVSTVQKQDVNSAQRREVNCTQSPEVKAVANANAAPANPAGVLAAPVPAPRSRRTSSSSDSDSFMRSVSLDSSSTPVAAPRTAVQKTSREDSTESIPPKIVEMKQNGNSESSKISATPRTNKFLQSFRTSKFKHLKGEPMKNMQVDNLRDLSTSVPGECDGLVGNARHAAVPMKGPGGKVAIFELSQTGRLPDGLIPVIQNTTTLLDLAWDPFDGDRLATACDDGIIRLWRIPDGGLKETMVNPEDTIKGPPEKLYCIKFNPLAKDVLAVASNEPCVRIWDLESKEACIRLQGHSDQIFSLAWSPDGRLLATVCKDSKLRIYNPRLSVEPIKEGDGPVGNRGARIIWVLGGKCLVVTGFNRSSERQISVYNADDVMTPLTVMSIDVAPAIFIPQYDEDSNTVFVTAKGETTIYSYEVSSDAPFLFPLSPHKCPTPHQALAFLPKSVCNVREVEFARTLRLTASSIEQISFKVPRVKTEFFQDDLFPDTRITWKPSVSAKEWFTGVDRPPIRMSLRPDNMPLWSENSGNKSAPNASSSSNHVTPPKVAVVSSFENTERPYSPRSRTERLKALFSTRSMEEGATLPQDMMEGVEPEEWKE